MPQTQTHTRPTGLAVWLIIAGVIGWWAAFQLTVEKIFLLEHPDQSASCDFSVLVQCGKNIESWQGSVFGFANPILGVACWVAPIVVGAAILAGARFARWFWWLFWAGFAFAISFVGWLIYQSIFQLHTLCPWCMVTWAVTIPSFFAVTVHLLRSGQVPLGTRARHVAEQLMGWVPLMTIIAYGVVILLAQVRLNAIPNIWQTIRVTLGWA
ncbi:vitamin K epoxide reductase family protein [Microbacterium luticocti]|uniref:vitamin K epoxide reductase family protein n=1 Tax=Microbacterium luticocti TaxID=451764 RepID=UPI000429DDDA|nr:vitamin K epoxide reductase family protein [Microbacterium luticocti]